MFKGWKQCLTRTYTYSGCYKIFQKNCFKRYFNGRFLFHSRILITHNYLSLYLSNSYSSLHVSYMPVKGSLFAKNHNISLTQTSTTPLHKLIFEGHFLAMFASLEITISLNVNGKKYRVYLKRFTFPLSKCHYEYRDTGYIFCVNDKYATTKLLTCFEFNIRRKLCLKFF